MAGKMIETIKSFDLTKMQIIRCYNPASMSMFCLKGTICFNWLDTSECKCYCMSKGFLFITDFKRSFTCRDSQSFYICLPPLVSNANERFKRLETSAWHKNQCGSTSSMRTQCLFPYIYICAYAGCTHIYTIDIHVQYA